MTDKTEIWIIGIEGASVETFKRVKKELVKYKAPEDKYIIVPHQVSSIRIRMTDKTDSFEDRVQEFAKDLGAKRVEYMGFETKIVYALAIDEIGSLRSQLADARQRNVKLNEELGKVQSRDSSTTNKKLRKEIEKLKAELDSVRDQLQQATDYVGELERENNRLERGERMKTEAERLRAEARRQNDAAKYYCDLMVKYLGERDEVRKENTELIEILCDTLYQACGENGNVIDNRCLSAYEDACQFLNRKGKFKDYNGRTGILVG
jgi:DNA repair exonuclease SbcCD ATPase subunit